tara:strand:- start:790 stop:1524 length:735 start_codon:yes stop_codon:yes gene_type:complete
MILKNLGFIITDTPRSYIYLQVLKENNIFPSYFIYLKNQKKKEFPEVKKKKKENYFKVPSEFEKICGKKIDINFNILSQIQKLNIDYDVYNTTNIHNSFVIKRIISRKEKDFIYSGYSGVILKKSVLDSNKNFLHIHGGFLPQFKGSTTNYYSILEENALGASSIFMRQEIDSGPILYKSRFKVPKKKYEIDNFYDSLIRSIVLIKTIKIYCKNNKWPKVKNNTISVKNYYIIHPLLKHIAILS